ncbi:MAG: hypothetical protein IKV13_00555 [Akkermansia sp.]|nr:hypothetical protein [Akkermansia sp.]
MNRRYRPPRKKSNHTLPLAAAGLTVGALLLWGLFAKGQDIITFFKGQTVIVASNEEANQNLERLLGDLAGDKARLLELAENSRSRLGWIKNADTQRQFRWILLSRLVDKGQWAEAVRILPEVESLAPVEGLDRLAVAATEHGDFELQLRLDRELQDMLMNSPEHTELLLRSIRRTAETCIRMQRNDEAVKAIARLDAPGVLVRLRSPELAAEAAALQMMRAGVCAVKDPVLQMTRNILEQAKWPLCPATSQLMLEEVTSALRDNPNLPQHTLKEIEEKLLRCRDAMLEYPDKAHRLPQCYLLLGELRHRLGNHEGCAQALSLAAAFAEGYGEMTPQLLTRIARIRSRANEVRGNTQEAVRDYRYLLDHEKDAAEIMRVLTYLATHTEGEEKIALLSRSWEMMLQNPALVKKDSDFRSRIAHELAEYCTQKQEYNNALKWVQECTRMVEEVNPDLTTGKTLRARLNLALAQRKAQQDIVCFRTLRSIQSSIDQMSDADKERLEKAEQGLYRTTMRELSRTCLLLGDKTTAKAFARKIREDLPEKVR